MVTETEQPALDNGSSFLDYFQLKGIAAAFYFYSFLFSYALMPLITILLVSIIQFDLLFIVQHHHIN